MTIEQEMLNLLRSALSGMTIDEMETGLARCGKTVPSGMVECLLLLSRNFTGKGNRWFLKTDDKLEAVMEVVKRYIEESGRRIFKADAALRGLPDNLKPTREELAQILLFSNKYELLKNDMIREKD